MTEIRCLILVAAAILLAIAVVFPWMEVWPVDDVATYVKADPYNALTDFLPRVVMVPLWERDFYAVAVPFWPAILGQLGTIFGMSAWLWQLTRNAELRAGSSPKEPPYCGPIEVPAQGSMSGTVGPLG